MILDVGMNMGTHRSLDKEHKSPWPKNRIWAKGNQKKNKGVNQKKKTIALNTEDLSLDMQGERLQHKSSQGWKLEKSTDQRVWYNDQEGNFHGELPDQSIQLARLDLQQLLTDKWVELL